MIIKYQKQTDQHTTYTLVTPESSGCTELATIDGTTYVHVPDGVTLPSQPEQIAVEEVTMTDELREQIKAASPHVKLSYKRLNERIRAKYSIDDEMYLARIAVGAQMGTYEMQPDEPALLAEYQQYVEAQREIARLERAQWEL